MRSHVWETKKQEGGGAEEGTEDTSIDLMEEELEIRKRIEEVMVSFAGARFSGSYDRN